MSFRPPPETTLRRFSSVDDLFDSVENSLILKWVNQLYSILHPGLSPTSSASILTTWCIYQIGDYFSYQHGHVNVSHEVLEELEGVEVSGETMYRYRIGPAMIEQVVGL